MENNSVIHELIINALVEEDKELASFYISLALEEGNSQSEINEFINEGIEIIKKKYNEGVYSFAELKMAEIIQQELCEKYEGYNGEFI